MSTLDRGNSDTDGPKLATASVVFPLGFIFSPAGVFRYVPDGYVRACADLNLYVHSATRISVTRPDLAARVALIGLAVDENEWWLSHGQIAENLAIKLGADWETFLQSVDRLAGRFAIVFHGPDGKWMAINDAIGIRSIYFGRENGETFISSHLELLADQLESANRRRPIEIMWGYPGLFTPRHEIYWLVPNHVLNLETCEMGRIFPLAPITCQSPQDVAWHCSRVGHNILNALTRETNVAISLTAGRDSRVTMAISLALLQSVEFFTYWYDRGSNPYQVDLSVARRLCDEVGAKHTEVTAESQFTFPTARERAEFFSQIARNSYGRHMVSLLPKYFYHFGQWKYVHVRSNMYELGRGSLQQRYPRHKLQTAEDLAVFYRDNATARANPDSRVVHDSFALYYQKAQWDSGLRYISGHDLYFIEHRMPVWQSNVMLESDAIFETAILFNSRNTIRHLLGVPLEDRKANSIFDAIIGLNAPCLQRIPYNPKQWPI